MPRLAEILAGENVVGWVQGRMEFGPRALGGRSILGDPRSAKMQTVMNLKIKYRESFRPFAPSVLADRVSDYFELERREPLHADRGAGAGEPAHPADRRSSRNCSASRSSSSSAPSCPRSRMWTTRPGCRPCTRRPTRATTRC